MTDPGPKPDLVYPCKWSYKVICTSEGKAREAIGWALEGKEYEIISVKASRNQGFFSVECELEVETEAERLDIYEKLKQYPDVKMII